ncbi:MAG: methyltransferase domain-containing protein [Chloroflexi bacterium]|nr:methyltransferase domain-containing protein [Chloroflexota bacterium]
MQIDERLRSALAKWDSGPYMTFLRPTVAALVEAARIRPGMRVLDAGSGFGDPALEITTIVGPTGHVVGIDHDRLSLDIARDRAATLGVVNVEFRETEVTAVDLTDASFDAIVSRNVVVYFADPVPFLKELHRLLVPGGRVAVATWTGGDRNPLMTSAFTVLRRHAAPEPTPATTTPQAERVNTQDTAALASALRAAGFTDVTHGAVTLSFPGNPDDADLYWEQRRAGSPASHRILERMTEAQQRRAETEVVEATRDLIMKGNATGELGWAAGTKP